MRFHVVSLAHTNVTRGFATCAFTQKVRRFVQMMTARGHEVILYAGTETDVEPTEFVQCISEPHRAEIVGDNHYSSADWGHPGFAYFNSSVINQMRSRLQPQDFICLIGGYAQRAIADAYPNHISVEFGIGYSGTFAKYKVFESYAWMHMIYGAAAGNASHADGSWWDAVIPNQFDGPVARKEPEDYALYVGRMIDRKGFRVAQEVCAATGTRLILAGPGEERGTGYGEFIGEVDATTRNDLMARSKCLFAPTVYVEPFGTVTIEAMAHGTPVISTDWGAFTETVEHGVHGFRCRTFREFATALGNVHLLDRDAIAAYAQKRFSMETVGKQYEEYFARLHGLWGAGWYA